MKLFKFLPALLIALAVLVAGCGQSKEQQQLDQMTADQQKLVENTLREVNAVSAQIAKLSSDTKRLADSARDLEFEMKKNQMNLDDLGTRLGELQQSLAGANQSIRASQDAKKDAAAGGMSFWKLLGILVAIAIAILLIYLVLRSRSDYNEEEDDLSDFEDDDLGFEDDFEEDFEEEDFLDDKEKKAGEGDDDKK